MQPDEPMNQRPTHPHEEFDMDDYDQCMLFKIYPDSCGSYMWQAGVCVNLGEWVIGNEDLDARFAAWADEFPDHPNDPSPVPTDCKWQDWARRGLELAKEVRAIVPDDYTIFYYPFTAEPCEIQ
jgi:hypothetical protein